jgi:transcriptional regulator with XRE-family HTH domain
MVMEMVKTGSRFQKIFEEAKQHPAYWMEDLRLQFLNDIYEIMQEQKLAQKDLAEKMGVSEAYISKVFNGNVEKNFTLKTLVELSRAVNAEIRITVTPKESEGADHSEGTN